MSVTYVYDSRLSLMVGLGHTLCIQQCNSCLLLMYVDHVYYLLLSLTAGLGRTLYIQQAPNRRFLRQGAFPTPYSRGVYCADRGAPS
jgi:hypothetical protein